jgi:hypothetical protein
MTFAGLDTGECTLLYFVMSDGPNQPPDDLQFQVAEPLPAEDQSAGARCVACKQPIGSTYYHAQGQVVCPVCADRIQSGQQSPPPLSLARAFLYGAGAALAGCLLYATVSIVTGLEIGLIAIVVGVMVGKAIRHASNGRGGRPQQILAVVLTYFAITTSYIPVIVYHAVKTSQQTAAAGAAGKQGAQTEKPQMAFGKAVLFLMLIAAAAPFLSLTEGISGLITLFIIFIGLQRAWTLTGRSQLLVMGPYETAPAA